MTKQELLREFGGETACLLEVSVEDLKEFLPGRVPFRGKEDVAYFLQRVRHHFDGTVLGDLLDAAVYCAIQDVREAIRQAAAKAVQQRRARRAACRAKSKARRQTAKAVPRAGIHAQAHSDDWRLKIEFDCTPWLAEATEEKLVELAEEGWGHCEAAEDIVYSMGGRDDQVDRLLEYLSLEPKMGLDPVGFECELVDVDKAMGWLRVHRPSAYARLRRLEDEDYPDVTDAVQAVVSGENPDDLVAPSRREE